MKILLPSALLSTFLTAASAACLAETSFDIGTDVGKLTIAGFDVPMINRFSSKGTGNMIVLKDYESAPVVTTSDGIITITAGDPCAEESSALSMLASISPFLMARGGVISPVAAVATALLMGSPFASAATGSITVEIYTDIDAQIHDTAKSGKCPPESFHFSHHPSVFGGYSGCVGEKYLLPCGQDAQGAEDSSLYAKTPINWNGSECVETGYTYEDRTFWILWGDPLDKHELMARTGLNPTVTFPLLRGPYPAYTHGTDETESMYDDASTAKATAKDFLVYLGAITENEKKDWYVSMTKGAEQGISTLWAAKALEIAQTTCNRDIYVLMEAPAYGYNNAEISLWANLHSSSFYSGEECACFPSCTEKTVSVINVGFFPPNIPSRLGGDGVLYIATSTSPSSPWFESMVFPENPSGTIKIPQLPANRRVCDGVYVWPMYFVYNDFEIPLEARPDCDGWTYATTKGYSAGVRAGFITYKKNPQNWVDAVVKVADSLDTIGYGIYSEWSWWGQMQIQEMMMSRPVDDPTSWVGAYGQIMKEKWDVLTEGFADCPVLSLTNSGKGAYAFFLYKEPYLGLQDSFVSSFFLDVLGVSATTYNWGFRGADPSEFYGDGVGTFDFTRVQLFRDLNVYIEVARRAKIVCADTSASIGDFVSIDDWKASATARKFRRNLKEHMPHLTNRQLTILEKNEELRIDFQAKSEACAPDYATSCMFKNIGTRFEDVTHEFDEIDIV